MTTLHALEICADCLIWQANGDDTSFCDCTAECTDADHQAVRNAPAVIVGGHDDDDRGFSWSPCELCRRPEAGDRYRAWEQA